MSLLKELSSDVFEAENMTVTNVSTNSLTVSQITLQSTTIVPPFEGDTGKWLLITKDNGTQVKVPLRYGPCTGKYSASTWPRSRGNGNQNSGVAFSVVAPSVVTDTWLCPFDGIETDCQGSSPAVAADGAIYVCTYNALNAVSPDGAFLWKFPLGNAEYSIPVVGEDGIVYVQDQANAYAIVPPVSPSTTPTEKWRVFVGDGHDAIPTIGCDGRVYVGTSRGLFALDIETGRTIWTIPSGLFLAAAGLRVSGSGTNAKVAQAKLESAAARVTAARRRGRRADAEKAAVPALLEVVGNVNGWCFAMELNTLYISTGIATFAINAVDGAIIWTNTTVVGGLYSMPIISLDGVYVGANDGLYKLNKATGAIIWVANASFNYNDISAALFKNYVYSGANVQMEAYDVATGATVWTYPGGGGNNACSPSVDGEGKVICVDPNNEEVVALDAATGAVIWTVAVDVDSNAYTIPAITPLGVYIATKAGLFAIF